MFFQDISKKGQEKAKANSLGQSGLKKANFFNLAKKGQIDSPASKQAIAQQ